MVLTKRKICPAMKNLQLNAHQVVCATNGKLLGFSAKDSRSEPCDRTDTKLAAFLMMRITIATATALPLLH
jgi:hypothetical protein